VPFLRFLECEGNTSCEKLTEVLNGSPKGAARMSVAKAKEGSPRGEGKGEKRLVGSGEKNLSKLVGG